MGFERVHCAAESCRFGPATTSSQLKPPTANPEVAYAVDVASFDGALQPSLVRLSRSRDRRVVGATPVTSWPRTGCLCADDGSFVVA